MGFFGMGFLSFVSPCCILRGSFGLLPNRVGGKASVVSSFPASTHQPKTFLINLPPKYPSYAVFETEPSMRFAWGFCAGGKGTAICPAESGKLCCRRVRKVSPINRQGRSV